MKNVCFGERGCVIVCVCTDIWTLGKRLKKNKGIRLKKTWKTRPRVIWALSA